MGRTVIDMELDRLRDREKDLLATNNTYLQQARDARSEVRALELQLAIANCTIRVLVDLIENADEEAAPVRAVSLEEATQNMAAQYQGLSEAQKWAKASGLHHSADSYIASHAGKDEIISDFVSSQVQKFGVADHGWTERDENLSVRDGWCLSIRDDGYYQIQCLDYEATVSNRSRRRFFTDFQAYCYVKEKADSEFYAKALRLHGTTHGAPPHKRK
jgi:hypothetical protein